MGLVIERHPSDLIIKAKMIVIVDKKEKYKLTFFFSHFIMGTDFETAVQEECYVSKLHHSCSVF